MINNYSNCSVTDFLEDPYFVSSVINPTRKSEKFWDEHIDSMNVKEYRRAVAFVKSMQNGKHRLLPYHETELLARINEANRLFRIKGKRRKRLLHFSMAACLVSLLAFSFMYLYQLTSVEDDIKSIAQKMQPVETYDETRLIFPKEDPIKVSEQTASITHEPDGKIRINTQLIDSPGEEKEEKEENQFIQLIVPPGKRSTLTLKDGSRLWVNAGTRVVYPVVFKRDKRELYVDGEIFIDVVPDRQRPFIVQTKKMNIRVHGTSFNVLAYENDSTQAVVLVSGLVSVKTESEEEIQLTPDRMLSYADGDSEIRSVNTDKYTSWRNGLYTSDSEELSSILDRLSRYYGKRITYDADIASLKFSGTLYMQETIDSILEGLCYSVSITVHKSGNSYKIAADNG